MKINWQQIKIYFVLIIVIIMIAILLLPQFYAQINLIALLSTLGVLIWYAYDTHRIANQTIEGNLRPLILRSGFIESWESIKFSIVRGELEGRPLEFSILKNIVKDISGYIIIANKKYQLIFANQISSKNIKEGISDLENRVLMYLYENYKIKKDNSFQSLAKLYKELNIEGGTYLGTITDSLYVRLDGDNIRLTNNGIRLIESDKPVEYRYNENWGWMNAGTIINAIFFGDKYEEVKEENQIYLIYCDMEGNKYFTKENKNFSQNSGKL